MVVMEFLVTVSSLTIESLSKTLVASEQNIVTQLHKNCAKQRNCFELYGFDLMLDRKGKVILIEVNVSPSLHSNSKLDETIKVSISCENI